MLFKVRESLPDTKEKKFKLNYKIEDGKLIIDLDFFIYKYDLYGKQINLSLIYKAYIKMARPVNGKKVLYEEKLIIDGPKKRVIVDLNKINLYSYIGKYIDLKFKLLFQIDDAIFFDTKVNKTIDIFSQEKVKYITDAKNIMTPKDTYIFFTNFMAIPIISKLFFLGIILGLSIVFYFNSDIFSLLFIQISVIVGIFLWFFTKKLFKTYMSFELRNDYHSEFKNQEHKLSEIISGESIIDLKDLKLRVVASNIEIGEHVVGSGKSTTTATFKKPVNGIILYEEDIPFLPKNIDISNYVKGSFSFKKMYEKLLPPVMIIDNHGLNIAWKIQLIHKTLIDQEIEGPISAMKYKDF